MFILSLLLVSFVLWILFIMIANLYHNSWHVDMVWYKKYPIMVLAGVGYVIDIIYNWTYASILFWDFPDDNALTLTRRLKQYLIREDIYSKRYRLAWFMCTKLIEPWDPNHCGLQGLEGRFV